MAWEGVASSNVDRREAVEELDLLWEAEVAISSVHTTKQTEGRVETLLKVAGPGKEHRVGREYHLG